MARPQRRAFTGAERRGLLACCSYGCALAPLLPVLLTGCLFYDSRWGQQKAIQRHVAAARAPAALTSAAAPVRLERTVSDSTDVRLLRLHVWSTHRYAAEVLDWQRQFEQVVQDANPTLHRDFSIELAVVQYRVSQTLGSDDDLAGLLERLQREDPGSGVDFVVGLASAVPGLATSPDQLGVGVSPGRHLVMRAMSDAEEFDALRRGFSELSEAETQKLYLSRKRHKAAAVLLHELGHTLALPHELEQDSLMNAVYSHRASDFSSPAREIVRATLAWREQANTGDAVSARDTTRAWAERVLAVIRAAPTHTWEGHSRDILVATLEPLTSHAAPASSARPTPAEPAVPCVEATPDACSVAALSEADRALFESAAAEARAGRPLVARERAARLFEAYPAVFAVQDLRCQLAMAIGGSWQSVRHECEVAMKLGLPAKPSP